MSVVSAKNNIAEKSFNVEIRTKKNLDLFFHKNFVKILTTIFSISVDG